MIKHHSVSTLFSIQNIALIFVVAILYYLSAIAGLMLAYENTNVTPIWPPAGIALAAVLLFGRNIWPGIALGAFAANLVVFLSNQVSDLITAIAISSVISIGNTLSVILGNYLIKKGKEDVTKLEKVKFVLQFASTVLIMCFISSSIGSVSICFARVISWNSFPIVWFTWWLGDVSGILIVTPLLLLWIQYMKEKRKWNKNFLMTLLLYGLIILVSGFIFIDWLASDSPFIKSYLILPVLLWAAFYFDQRTLITVIAVSSIISIFGTINGYGPFASPALNSSLLSLQAYICIMSLTVITLRAAIFERKAFEDTLLDAHQELILIATERKKELESYQKRVEGIFKAILQYTLMDFSQKTVVTEKGDELDAIAAGLNALREELAFYIHKLKDSEEGLRLLIENIKDYAIFRIDANGFVASWNKGAQQIKGYSAEEIIGKHLTIFYTPEEIERGEAEYNLRMAREKGRYESIGWRLRKDGSPFWADVIIAPLYDEDQKLTGYAKVTRDITEQKSVEEQLRNSESFLDSVVENIPNMLFVKDANNLKFIKFNRAGEELLGYSREELLGKNDYDFFPKEEADFFTSKDKVVLEEGKLFDIPEESIKTKYKGTRILETKKIPILDKEGKPKYLLGISNDITERKKLQESLSQRAEELSKLTQELTRSNAELEQFAYVASHDLQEPLRMVNSYVQLLSNRYKDKLDEDANDFIAFAVDGSNRMRTLIQSLLEYSRVNRVKPFEKINLNDLVNEVLHDLEDTIKVAHALIKVDKLPTITGDTVLIGQLFQNLIGNAIKFRGERNPEIIVSGKKTDGEYLFSIKDNGIGIQKEYSDKIFIIFQRLNGKDKYPGTGIGLAICKKIVERHGGHIWLESEVGKGSTFYFTIKEDIHN